MELVWLVYFISMLESIFPVLIIILIASVVVLALMLLTSDTVSYIDKDCPKYRAANAEQVALFAARNTAAEAVHYKRTKNAAIVAIISAFLLIVVPSTKTAYIMVGAYVAQKIVQDGGVQEIGNKVYQVINNKLDSYLVVPK